MFSYKQRGAAYFEEGAKRLTCDTMKGVWTVEKEGGYDELRRVRNMDIINYENIMIFCFETLKDLR